jgi:hypothetical protein
MKVFDPKKREFRDKKTNKVEPRSPRKYSASTANGAPLDEALEETFPASDPPAIVSPHKKQNPPKSGG